MEYRQTNNGRICKSFKNDCVIRSISIVTDKSYQTVFAELMELGALMGAYPSHDKVWIKYIERQGYTKHKPPRNAEGKLIKLRDWTSSPSRAVVRNSGHLTAIVDGTLVDDWDCRNRPVNSYWAK